VQKAREKVGHTFRLAAKVLSNPETMRLERGTISLSKAMRIDFAELMNMLRTRRGSRDLHWALQQGFLHQMPTKLITALTSESLAAQAGFSSNLKSSRGVLLDRKVAFRLWKLALGAAGAVATTSEHYTVFLPCAFVSLLHPNATVRTDTLALMRKCFNVLDKLEKFAVDPEVTAENRKECRAWLRDLLFPLEQWCREILIQLAEHDFQEPFNELLTTDLKGYVNAIKSTLMIENIIKRIRQGERESMSGKMPPRASWHIAATCSELTEFSRPLVFVTDRAKQAADDSLREGLFKYTVFTH
jgi:hypothetical protein